LNIEGTIVAGPYGSGVKRGVIRFSLSLSRTQRYAEESSNGRPRHNPVSWPQVRAAPLTANGETLARNSATCDRHSYEMQPKTNIEHAQLQPQFSPSHVELYQHLPVVYQCELQSSADWCSHD
jgi:hypothetical protein